MDDRQASLCNVAADLEYVLGLDAGTIEVHGWHDSLVIPAEIASRLCYMAEGFKAIEEADDGRTQ